MGAPILETGETIDGITYGIMTVDYPHHEIHSGDSYVIKEGIQLNNSSKEYLITTPNTTKWSHMVISVSGSQDTSKRLAEGTGKTGGTSMTAINRDRNSSNTAGIAIAHTPTGTEGTVTVIETAQWGVAAAGGGRGAVAGESRGVTEYILKQNTKYSLTVTALSANVNNITVSFDWYEHTNK